MKNVFLGASIAAAMAITPFAVSASDISKPQNKAELLASIGASEQDAAAMAKSVKDTPTMDPSVSQASILSWDHDGDFPKRRAEYKEKNSKNGALTAKEYILGEQPADFRATLHYKITVETPRDPKILPMTDKNKKVQVFEYDIGEGTSFKDIKFTKIPYVSEISSPIKGSKKPQRKYDDYETGYSISITPAKSSSGILTQFHFSLREGLGSKYFGEPGMEIELPSVSIKEIATSVISQLNENGSFNKVVQDSDSLKVTVEVSLN
jgi:hypothetical protein